jgi:hypothetical protein
MSLAWLTAAQQARWVSEIVGGGRNYESSVYVSALTKRDKQMHGFTTSLIFLISTPLLSWAFRVIVSLTGGLKIPISWSLEQLTVG